MPDLQVEVHPDAVAEARFAHAWYLERSPLAGRAFLQARHGTRPTQSGELADLCEWDARRYLFRRFPFFVVYRIASPVIQVVAIAHARRRPGYWRVR